MNISNVYDKDVKAAAVAQPETFKGYAVKDGKVQGGYFTSKSTLESVQKDYDTDKAAKNAWSLKTPFIATYKYAAKLVNWILDLFKNLFSICTYSKEAKADKK